MKDQSFIVCFLFFTGLFLTLPKVDFSQSGNQALRLDERPGHISIPYSPDFTCTEFTLEGWFKRSSFADNDDANGLFHLGGMDADAKLSMTSGGFPRGLHFAISDIDSNINAGSDVRPIWPNLWYHIAATYDGQIGRIYIDGELVGADTGTVDISSFSPPLIIGEYISQFEGDIDDVRFWNTARTQEEIHSFMHRGDIATAEGLVGFWRFDDSNSTEIMDASIHNNHGYIEGTAEFVPSRAYGSYKPLSTPKGFRGWGEEEESVLRWMADTTEDILGYTLYRSETIDFDLMDEDSVAFIPFPGTNYNDPGLVNDVRYYYRLRVCDPEGRYSRPTRSLVVKPTLIRDDYVTAVAYYPWYYDISNWQNMQGEFNLMRSHLIPAQLPELGYYQSHDSLTIQKHIEWAEAYGIDVLAVSWWGDLGRASTVVLRDYIAPRLIGHALRYCIFMEFLWHPDRSNLPTEIGEREIGLFIDYLTELANDHFGHPNYYSYQGKPVIILYSTFNYFGDLENAFGRIREALLDQGYDIYLIGCEMGYSLPEPSPAEHMSYLDAITEYVWTQDQNETGCSAESGFLLRFADYFNRKALLAESLNIQVVPNVSPGFNSRGTWNEESLINTFNPILARQTEPGAGSTSTLEEEIRMMRSFTDPDLNLIWITSWNEWFEDSQIEPTVITSPTNQDDSQTGDLYTSGFTYEGYGTKMLEVVNNLLGGDRAVLSFDPPDAVTVVGEHLRIEMSIENVTNLGGYQFDLAFNAATVRVDTVQPGSFIENTGRTVRIDDQTIDNITGTLSFSITSSGTASGVGGDGVLCIIELTALEPGESLLEPQAVVLKEVDGSAIALGTPIPCRIRIREESSFWTPQLSGCFRRLLCVSTVSKEVAWSAGERGTIIRTIDGGQSWHPVWNGAERIIFYSIEALDNNTAIVAGIERKEGVNVAFIYRTENGGATWEQSFNQDSGWIGHIKMFNENDGIAIGDPQDDVWTILKTTDAGKTWIPIENSPSAEEGESLNLNSVFWVNDSLGGFSTNATGFLHTTDSGETWNKLPIPVLPAAQKLAFNSKGYGIAGYWDGSMVESTDHGISWLEIYPPEEGILRQVYAYDNFFWLAVDSTIYMRTDTMQTWKQQYTGNTPIRHLEVISEGMDLFGWACGENGTILKYEDTLISTGFENGTSAPRCFQLWQNYPNPFHSGTTIRFTLPAREHVRITVYTVFGQKVCELVNQQVPEGDHTIAFNAQDLRAGMYIVRMEAGGFQATQKMLHVE